jgi:hypothetical protein
MRLSEITTDMAVIPGGFSSIKMGVIWFFQPDETVL